MGTDKAFVEVGGIAMVERVATALTAGGCAPIVLVGGDTELLARFGHDVVADRFPGEGPAGGVLTALDALDQIGADRAVVAACDLPALDGATVASLAAALDGGTVDAVVAVTDRWQLSITAWRRAARPHVAAAWEQGIRSLHELVTAVSYAEVTIDPAPLRNVNTPEALAAADDASR